MAPLRMKRFYDSEIHVEDPETGTSKTVAIPTLSQSACGVLTVLSGGVADGAHLSVQARTLAGLGSRQLNLRVGPRADLIDVPLLELIEEDQWAAHVRLAVREPGTGPIYLAALSASWGGFPPILLSSAMEPPRDALVAAEQAALTFALEPTAIILGGTSMGGGGFTVTALYGLAQRLDVRDTDGQARALDRLRRLARALGALPPADDTLLGDIAVPVPGMLIRELILRKFLVTCSVCEPTRVYTLDRIDAAIDKGARS